MERLIESKLIEWKRSKARKPLLIRGARQIGKTYTMLRFGKEHYENVVYCNFESNLSLAKAFEDSLNPFSIIDSLKAIFGVSIEKGTTLIVFDEIQRSEKALASLKYFCEEANEYHIIAAGSLLGLAVNRGGYSFPVGKVDLLDMGPMSFEEFLMATGNKPLIDRIKESFRSCSPCPVHDKAMELYRTYLLVGGYPEAVKTYIESGDFLLVKAIQANISGAYIADMAKYSTPSETVKSMEIYDSICAQLAKESTKFQYNVVNPKARSKTYEVSLSWLKSANVILECRKITEGNAPINLYEESSSFKIYYCDVGLLTLKGNFKPESIFSGLALSSKARGMLAENYVAQQLISKGFVLHYWESGNTAEVDFVVNIDYEPIPIEVKSADNVKAKSLKMYMNRYKPKYAIRISSKNFGFEKGIKSIPLYALFCL